jgi:hypothetical protein
MKQIIFKWILIAILGFLSTTCLAQQEKPLIPNWHSDKGYWVIEDNINTPLEHTIWFFNNDKVLLYKENLRGVKLNPAKRSVKMKLKKVLENAVHNWETKKVAEENKSYVAAILR